MILADTSVWVDHLAGRRTVLAELLEANLILGHPWVHGELAMGTLRDRVTVLGLIGRLPQATAADEAEIIAFVDAEGLAGTGLGWVDAGLLAASRLSDAALLTSDRRLATAARRLGVAHTP